ncbi:MAG: DUF4384 domain-containing protein [Verrucomicrobia bacterium]|nr:DUF4384 domain-containing protein [Verrucomicrobiota bacterium]
MNEEDTDQKTTVEPGVAPSPEVKVPPIPDHQVLRRIGQGSYGEVWLALNVVGTCRAVKIVYRRTFSSARPYEREFAGIRKFEPISRAHEGLVDILQIGRNDQLGYFYYVMELADDASTSVAADVRRRADSSGPNRAGAGSEHKKTGRREDEPVPSSPALVFSTSSADSYVAQTLAAAFKAHGRLPLAECLPLALALSDALGFLHQRGLVHRDIKPSNIIFVEGVPKLADIGLVTETAEARTFVGTEGFIPPEGPGTVQADIFSLGKVFYQMWTGKDRHEFPDLPSDLADATDRPDWLKLNEIILKACEGDAKKRYQTAEQLSTDLLTIKTGEPLTDVAKPWFRPMQWLSKVAPLFAGSASEASSATEEKSNAAEPAIPASPVTHAPSLTGGLKLQTILDQRGRVEEFQRTHRIGLLTLLFTDMVGSTKLKQQLGDVAAVAMMQRHHELVRQILQWFPEGLEISTSGDSFFLVFAKPSDAVRFSLMLQAQLRALAKEKSWPIADRIGVHIGEVMIQERPDLLKARDLYGLQVDICARVMSLAEGNQILLTRSAFDNARQILKGQELPDLKELLWINHGSYELKGVEEPMEICEVGEIGEAALKPPPDSDKVHRHTASDQNQPALAKVAALPAADVLKIAFASTPPPAPAQAAKPQLQFEVLAKGREQSAFRPVADGDSLRSEIDDYVIVCRPLSDGYLYVFQVDAAGRKDWLFPQNQDSNFSSGTNPVRTGQVIQMPATDGDQVLYLDRTTGVEHIYAVFSAAAWPELEQALKSSGTPTGVELTRIAARVEAPNGLRTRGVGGIRTNLASTGISPSTNRVHQGQNHQLSLGGQVLEATGSFLALERWFKHVD